jgi:VWFA-related protein
MTDEHGEQRARTGPARRRSTVRQAMAWLVATCAAGGGLLAQEPASPPRPAFSGGTDVVRLEVSVIGKDRKPVRGLSASDFTVLENGKERPVVAFASVSLPTPEPTAGMPTASWVRDAPLDVVSNAGADTGRLVTIAFDWSVRGLDLVRARRIALAAVDGLGPWDDAAILFSSPFSNAGVPQNFTADRSRLRARINQAVATALVDKDGVIVDPDGYESGGCLCGTCTLEALTRVAKSLRGVSQRPKVVLFISTYARTYEMMAPPRALPRTAGPAAQAFAATNSNANTCPGRLLDTRRTFERAAGEANITVHSLDPAGLGGDPPLGAARERERLDSLAVLPDMTGGRTVQGTNAPEALVPAILEESGSYYVLGFTPASITADGRPRHLDVRVRPKGLLVKARTEYTLEPLSDVAAAAALPHALGGVLPSADVPLAVSAVPLIAGLRSAVVIVGRLEDGLTWPITLMPAAFSPRGAPVTSRRVTLRPVTGSGTRGPLGVVSALALEPGPYEVRVAAQLAGGITGSVHTFVDMPDFAREPLSMSGVLFHVSPEEVTAPRDEIDDVLPFVPTARRAFAQSETVSVFAQVSQGTSRTAPLQAVAVRARIVDVHDTAIRDERSVLAANRFKTNRTANLRLSLPIQTLPPGSYLLTVTAMVGQHTAERLVRFHVG